LHPRSRDEWAEDKPFVVVVRERRAFDSVMMKIEVIMMVTDLPGALDGVFGAIKCLLLLLLLMMMMVVAMVNLTVFEHQFSAIVNVRHSW
jgi:hypothetical protein